MGSADRYMSEVLGYIFRHNLIHFTVSIFCSLLGIRTLATVNLNLKHFYVTNEQNNSKRLFSQVVGT